MTAPLSSVSFGKVRELIESYSKKMAILFFFDKYFGKSFKEKGGRLFIYIWKVGPVRATLGESIIIAGPR